MDQSLDARTLQLLQGRDLSGTITRPSSPLVGPGGTTPLLIGDKRWLTRPISPELGELGGSLSGGVTVGDRIEDALNKEQFEKLCQAYVLTNCVDIMDRYDFNFKQRKTVGRPIHIAALHRDGHQLVGWLVGLKANVSDECAAMDNGSKASRMLKLQPIHLAAGQGNVEVLRELIDHGASVAAATTTNGKEHYFPLHEAAYFKQAAAVSFLLERRADPNSRNINSQTPLHVASAVGSPSCAKLLVAAGANLRAQDSKGSTPLVTAIGSRYPDRDLGILARPCIHDLLEVAKEAPAAAAVLLQDTDSWRKGLVDPSKGYPLPTTRDLVTLLSIAPTVGASLLDILTVVPKVTDPFHNPLPRHARRDTFEFRLCEYTKDTTWGQYSRPSSDKGIGDKLRYRLSQLKADAARADSGKTDDDDFGNESRVLRLHIRMLHLPNIVCFDMIHALSRLSTSEEMVVFQRASVQALLDFVWVHLVRLEYTANIVSRVIELAFLVWVTFAPPRTDDTRRLSWSFLTATATRSAWTEVAQIIGCYKYVKSFRSYFENTWNYVDAGTIGSFMFLTWGAFGSMVFDREVLALVSFFRWIQLLYMTGAYKFLSIGYKIVPIFQSFFQVSGIATITLFTFLAFFHAFAALENADLINPSEVFLNAFKLLLLSDGDGINYILSLGGLPDNGGLWTQCFLYFGALIFCVCTLNLFIAVHGGAYSAEFARVVENFYMNRAWISLGSMLQPRWRVRLPMGPLCCYMVLMSGALAVWLLLLLWLKDHVLPTIWLTVAFVLGDVLLRKRPWEEDASAPWQLWGQEASAGSSSPKVTPAPEDAAAAVLPATSPEGSQAGSIAMTLAQVKEEPSTKSLQEPEQEVRPKPTTNSSLSKASTPRLKAEMFLWWASWSCEEDRHCEDDRLLADSLCQLHTRVRGLGEQVAGQESHFGKLSYRLDGLGRYVQNTRNSMDQTLQDTLSRFDGRLEESCRNIGGMDGRLGRLEEQVSELRKGLGQIASCCEALASRASTQTPPTVVPDHNQVIPDRGQAWASPYYTAGLREMGQVQEAMERRTPVTSPSHRPHGLKARKALSNRASDGGAELARKDHEQQGGDAGGGAPVIVRSADAGGGGPRIAGMAGLPPVSRHDRKLSTREGDGAGTRGEVVSPWRPPFPLHREGANTTVPGPPLPERIQNLTMGELVEETDLADLNLKELPTDWGA